MAIRFKRILRFSDPTDKSSVKRTYPIISYKYDTAATLKRGGAGNQWKFGCE